MKDVPRSKDDRILKALKMRYQGIKPSIIATRLGMNPTYLRTVTNEVMKADLAESGEPDDIVRMGYW